jgi:hypothetical protein
MDHVIRPIAAVGRLPLERLLLAAGPGPAPAGITIAEQVAAGKDASA